jgi:hypothetical protein
MIHMMIISLNSINQLVFISEMQRTFYANRNWILNII